MSENSDTVIFKYSAELFLDKNALMHFSLDFSFNFQYSKNYFREFLFHINIFFLKERIRRRGSDSPGPSKLVESPSRHQSAESVCEEGDKDND